LDHVNVMLLHASMMQACDVIAIMHVTCCDDVMQSNALPD